MSFSFFQFDNSRKILIFGNDQALVKAQQSWLMKDSSGVAERDIQIVSVNEGSTLLSQYGVAPNQFMIILIGKDGGEKFRSVKPETTKTLFAIIDAMPMRQSEMKKKG